MDISKVRRFRDSFLIAVFFILITTPMVVNIFDIDPAISISGNRQSVSAPELLSQVKAVRSDPVNGTSWLQLVKAIYAFPRAFEFFYNEQFGLRNTLIRAHSITMLLGFPTQSDVILGKDGWLFLGVPDVLSTYRKTEPFTVAELEKLERSLESQSKWLDDHGIAHLIVIAPEKSSIYPEFMPDNISILGDQSRVDQLLSHLNQNSNIHLLDLRDIFLDSKGEGELLYKVTDSHWNELGALLVSQTIINYLDEQYPQLTSLSRSEFNQTEQTISGDLTNMLALKGILTESAPHLEPVSQRRSHSADITIELLPETTRWGRPQSTEIYDTSLPTVIMFRDSFATNLMPLLSESFSRITYLSLIQMEAEVSILEQEKPNIVIYELAERHLHKGIPFADIFE